MGGQYHHELMKYCPPSYVLCVSSHFWPFNIVKFVLEKLDKNLGSADPPPSVGPKSQIFPKIRFEGFPKSSMMSPSACLPSPKTPTRCSAVVRVLLQLSGNSNDKSSMWGKKSLESKNGEILKNLHFSTHVFLGGSCTTLCTQNGT